MRDWEVKKFIPLYLQVADWIRENIYGGDWNYGEQIISENQIVDMLKVSRGTVKKAIAILCNEGLLTQVRGKGTFVTDNNIAYPLGRGLLSFAESLERQNIKFATEVIKEKIEKANAYTSQKLNIPEGSDVFYLERIRSVDGEKVMLIENRINIALCKTIDEIDFTTNYLFPMIEKISKRKIKFAESKYAARIVGQDRAQLLNIPEDAPVLHLEQIVHLDTNVPVEFGNVWLKSNKYYLGMVYQR